MKKIRKNPEFGVFVPCATSFEFTQCLVCDLQFTVTGCSFVFVYSHSSLFWIVKLSVDPDKPCFSHENSLKTLKLLYPVSVQTLLVTIIERAGELSGDFEECCMAEMVCEVMGRLRLWLPHWLFCNCRQIFPVINTELGFPETDAANHNYMTAMYYNNYEYAYISTVEQLHGTRALSVLTLLRRWTGALRLIAANFFIVKHSEILKRQQFEQTAAETTGFWQGVICCHAVLCTRDHVSAHCVGQAWTI